MFSRFLPYFFVLSSPLSHILFLFSSPHLSPSTSLPSQPPLAFAFSSTPITITGADTANNPRLLAHGVGAGRAGDCYDHKDGGERHHKVPPILVCLMKGHMGRRKGVRAAGQRLRLRPLVAVVVNFFFLCSFFFLFFWSNA